MSETKAKKKAKYFEPCTSLNCNLRFGSEKSLLDHIEGHRKEAVQTILPRQEHRDVLSLSAHHQMLKDRLKHKPMRGSRYR